MNKNIILFSLSANEKLTAKVAEILRLPIGKCELEHFADGEVMARPLESVRNRDVFVIQSTSAPAAERIFELLVFIDALKNAEAKTVTLVMPYFGYSRQDRIARPGEPITAKMVASLYQTVGCDRIITIDLHTQQIQGFFSCPLINLDTTHLFASFYKDYFAKNNISTSDVAVVSPDHGSALRARDLSSEFEDASLVVIDKRRPAPNKSEVTNVIGDVLGKYCVIVDDIVDTCGTLNNAVEALFKKGAKEVFVCATHAILSSSDFDKRIKKIVVTDTVDKSIEGVEVLSVANIIAEAIIRD